MLSTDNPMLYLIMLFVVVMPVIITIHELGHALPALRYSRKMVTIYLGAHAAQKKAVTFKIGLLHVEISAGIFGGGGLCQYQKEGLSFKQQLRVIITAPACNLLTTAVCTLLLWLVELPVGWQIYLTLLGFFSLVIGIANLVPFRFSRGGVPFKSDGYLIRQLWQERRLPKMYATAMKYYREKAYATAATLLTGLIEGGYKTEELCRHAAYALVLDRDYEKALPLFRLLEKNYGYQLNDIINRGVAKLHTKDIRGATEDFDLALQMAPNNYYSLNNKGHMLLLDKDYGRALPFLDKAIAANDTLYHAYNNRGLVWIKMGAKAEGLADIQRAFDLQPGNAVGYLYLGHYHLQYKEHELAIQMYRKVKEVDAKQEVEQYIKECEACLQTA